MLWTRTRFNQTRNKTQYTQQQQKKGEKIGEKERKKASKMNLRLWVIVPGQHLKIDNKQ